MSYSMSKLKLSTGDILIYQTGKCISELPHFRYRDRFHDRLHDRFFDQCPDHFRDHLFDHNVYRDSTPPIDKNWNNILDLIFQKY